MRDLEKSLKEPIADTWLTLIMAHQVMFCADLCNVQKARIVS